jgi:uncharacterized membrane protein YgcG
MQIFSSDGQPRLSAHVRALSAGLGIYAAHLMPPVVVIVLVASVVVVAITVVLTAVFCNPDMPPGVSASWLLCVLLGRRYEPPRRRGTLPAGGRGGTSSRKTGGGKS